MSWCGATAEKVKVTASRPQICKCERFAGSDGCTVLVGIYIYIFNSFAPHPVTSKQRAPQGRFSILAFWQPFFSWDLCYISMLTSPLSILVVYVVYLVFLSLIFLRLFHYRVPEAPVLVGSSHATRSLKRALFLLQWHVSTPSAPPILR